MPSSSDCSTAACRPGKAERRRALAGKVLLGFSSGNPATQWQQDARNTVTLVAGKKASRLRFAGDDTMAFCCNLPRHFDAGMRYDPASEGKGHRHSGSSRVTENYSWQARPRKFPISHGSIP